MILMTRERGNCVAVKTGKSIQINNNIIPIIIMFTIIIKTIPLKSKPNDAYFECYQSS